MSIAFSKYQGTGNDFIIIDDREFNFPADNQLLIEKLCNRQFGIGADGLILLQNVEGSDFKMVYYNSDGKESTMCGNGGRCIVAFAERNNLIRETCSFTAIDGEHTANIWDGIVELKMKDLSNIQLFGEDLILNTGSPHYVKFVNNVADFQLISEAGLIRYNDKFKEDGINVNFVQVLGQDSISIRTYERGVEDETLSCGTGAVASALSYHRSYNNTEGKHKVKVKVVGGLLQILFTANTIDFTDVWLCGSAQFVFEGTVEN